MKFCCVQVFHAGTARDAANNIAAVGGRVLGISATGKDVLEAQQNAYKVPDKHNRLLHLLICGCSCRLKLVLQGSAAFTTVSCRLWIP